MSRKTIAYIASSVDGFIAKKGDDLSFLNKMHLEGEDYGYKNFLSEVDTVILGSNTYRWVMKQVPEFPHTDKETFVITREKKDALGNVQFYSGDLNQLILSLKSKLGKNIFIDGGGRTITALLKLKAIDELHLFTVPVLLGEGIRLFQNSYPEQELKLIESKSYPSGMTLNKYMVTHQ
jgi:dihydrofolate reductase